MAVVLALGVTKLPLGAQAFAQAKKKDADAAAAKVDTGAIQRAYAGGTRSFEAGDMAGAEQQLSVALAGGGLPNSQMARALYLRGAAARRLGKPAQAIADLTTAVWLKGGLSDTDKAKATEERQLAYREAGLGDTPPPIGAAPLDQGASTASTPAPKTGAQVVQVTNPSFWNNFSMPSMSLPSFGSLTGSSSEPAAAAAPAAALSGESAPAQVAAAPDAASSSSSGGSLFNFQSSQPAETETASTQPSSSWDTQTSAHTATLEAPATPQPISTGYAPTHAPDAGLNPMSASASPAPQGTISNPLAGSGTAVSNFFGNMFGTSPSAAQAPATPVGSTEHAQNWGPESTVVTAQTSSMVQRGPDSPPPSSPAKDDLPWSTSGGGAPAAAPVKVAATGGAGKYKLQVAAVRSREEAEKLAQSLHGFQPVKDGAITAEIDEAVIGSMGTFYRVRLGPYADAKEPGQLCKTLKPQGFDCLVVTQ